MGENQVKAWLYQLWRAADTCGCHVPCLWDSQKQLQTADKTRWGHKQVKQVTRKTVLDKNRSKRTKGTHKMSNFKMSTFIFVFLISTKSYSFSSFCSLKKMWWKWIKINFLALCAIYNSTYLPGSTKTL